MSLTSDSLNHPDHFIRRHIGPNTAETAEMLALLGRKSLDELVDAESPELPVLDVAGGAVVTGVPNEDDAT